jgi:hypothetical protein
VTKWFLEFFLSMRVKENEKLKNTQERWKFGLIAEVTERGWIVWVLKRMREAVEEKVCSKFSNKLFFYLSVSILDVFLISFHFPA